MKTLELKLKKDVLIVEVDKSFNHFKIYDDEIGFIFIENSIPRKELIKGSYKFLCKGPDITEEIASELVEVDYSNFQSDDENYELKKNYVKGTFEFMSFEDSFISAVESKKFHWLENPIDEPNKYVQRCMSFENLSNQFKLFDEKEEKTFRNPLIFVKNA